MKNDARGQYISTEIEWVSKPGSEPSDAANMRNSVVKPSAWQTGGCSMPSHRWETRCQWYMR